MTPGAYVRSVAGTGTGIDVVETLSGADWAAEYLLMGLRIEDGVSIQRYADLAGMALNQIELGNLIQDGFLRRQGDRLNATSEGRLVLNAVTEKLLIT